MNTIIIAALALLVLVIVAMIFSGRIQVFGSTSKDCESKGVGAHCDNPCEPGEVEVGTADNTDCTGGDKCCLPVE